MKWYVYWSFLILSLSIAACNQPGSDTESGGGGDEVCTEKLFLVAAGPNGNQIYTTTDGSTWSYLSTYPILFQRHGVALSFNGRLFYFGGYGDQFKVYSSVDGVTWEAGNDLPNETSYAAGVVFNGKIWIAGGLLAPARDETLFSVDGASWSNYNAIADLRDGHSMVVFNDLMWIIAGRSYSPTAEATGRVYSSSDGQNWNSIGTLPATRSFGSAAIFNSKIWYAGGQDILGNPRKTVWNSTDGITWNSVADMPEERASGSLVVFNSKLWYIGGNFGGDKDTIWSTTDGSVWIVEDNLPGLSYGHSALLHSVCVTE